MAAKVVNSNIPMLDSLKSITYEQLQTLAHRELRSEGVFGSFFVALADVTRDGHVPDGSPRLPRLRRNIKVPERPDFRSGEGEGFSSSPSRPSSSPTNRAPIPTPIPTTPTPISKTLTSLPPNSSPFTVSSEYVPDQQDGELELEDQLDRKHPEVVSANMAAQFISTVLDVYSSGSNKNHRSEFCIGPTTLHLVSHVLNCTCQDDGAAWRRKYDPDTRAWINKSELLFSLEVKSSYSQSDSSGMGIPSNRTLAQQFCELLGSVMSKVERKD
ncbi:658a249e-31ac-4398-ab7f-dd68b60dd291 [Sclerotinia trifoliorum]|uniref:658a249e-31ac-4398-ab7f-dd68b60dd291 n=1 Tax=Sclerotinia trifoliorum TaxID=28548 RepID=A0A8H2VQF1_9HELO|nr:658a249e-31ac-4398-ab7f-dd68b60dd291 [Sclerotinia trifoliorum]